MDTPNSKTFCSVPFTEIYTENDGSFIHCCNAVDTSSSMIDFFEPGIKNSQGERFSTDNTPDFFEVWNSQFYKKLRQDLIQGRKNSACNYCWRLEAEGAASDRNPQVPEHLEKTLNLDFSMSSGPRMLDLKIGNTCNLKCIMCHPANSSLHHEEVKEWKDQGETPPSAVDITDQESTIIQRSFTSDWVFENLESSLGDIEEIQLHGGEPLVSREVRLFLDKLITQGVADSLRLKIITNLAVANREIFQRLDCFASVELIISWDHTDPKRSEYIRHPQRYDRFCDNWCFVRQTYNFDIKISNTISVFNVVDIPQIYDQFETLNRSSPFSVSVGLVEAPRYFNAQYLDTNTKQITRENIQRWLESAQYYKIFSTGNCGDVLKQLPEWISHEPEDKQKVLKEQQRVLDLYDRTRKTDTKSLFPYLR